MRDEVGRRTDESEWDHLPNTLAIYLTVSLALDGASQWYSWCLKMSECRTWNITQSWTTEWPTSPCFGQSLSSWELTTTESYWLNGLVGELGMAWRDCGGSRVPLWYDICCTCTLCHIWSLVSSLMDCTGIRKISSVGCEMILVPGIPRG